MDAVNKTYFYNNEEEKTKLNWFTYEYANVLHDSIIKHDQYQVVKKELKDKNKLIEFCVYLTKRILSNVKEVKPRKEHRIEILPEYIKEFYTEITFEGTKMLFESSIKAWEQHANNCRGCPVSCMNDKDGYTKMFDEIDNQGYYK